MIAELGKPGVLAVAIIRNGMPLTGQEVVASVIRDSDGSLEFGPVDMVETSRPGFYSIEWPGSGFSPLTAIFEYKNQTYTEPIDLIPNTAPPEARTIVGELSLPQLDSFIFMPDICAEVGDQELVGEVDTEEQSGLVQVPKITGETDNDKIEGSTVC